jgi:hypothetical protein
MKYLLEYSVILSNTVLTKKGMAIFIPLKIHRTLSFPRGRPVFLLNFQYPYTSEIANPMTQK